MAVSLLLPISALAQSDAAYRINGVFTWGKIISMLCGEGWCRTSLPRDFYNLEVPINIWEKDFDAAFKAVQLQALADGYVLRKTGRNKPYTVTVKPKTEEDAAYVSCVDSSVQIVPSKYLKEYRHADSLKCSKVSSRSAEAERLCKHPAPPPTTGLQAPGGGYVCMDSVFVPLDRYRVNFYVVSSSFLDSYGVDWVELWASGNLWSTPQFFSNWSVRAVAAGDTLSEFRSIEIDIDSTASLHWGSQKKEEKSTYQTGDVVRTDYEYHDYGLTLDLHRSVGGGISGKYSLAQRDDMNSIIEGSFGGGGSDSVSTFGVFDSYQYTSRGIPFLSDIPLFGILFSHKSVDKIKSFFMIEIVQLKKIVLDTVPRFYVIDSIRTEEWNYRGDSSSSVESSSSYQEEDYGEDSEETEEDS